MKPDKESAAIKQMIIADPGKTSLEYYEAYKQRPTAIRISLDCFRQRVQHLATSGQITRRMVVAKNAVGIMKHLYIYFGNEAQSEEALNAQPETEEEFEETCLPDDYRAGQVPTLAQLARMVVSSVHAAQMEASP